MKVDRSRRHILTFSGSTKLATATMRRIPTATNGAHSIAILIA